MTEIIKSDYSRKDFEALQLTNEHGAEYRSARDLQAILGIANGGAL